MGEQVLFGMTYLELVFSLLLSLAITIKVDDYLEKRKLIKEEIKRHFEDNNY